ncbi:hypothetical protein SBOR_1018 [Sclerotinia borealis F-4128]|uniref:Uncharacterized protein n=1 Tax=Sclerotinia borealis (strain F-4128) TaxID=1432307 RepID=W9CR51_SCLBF|nr:hypothetical protein SBOR_1018 [Sclerotinia borealis F-4128]
MNVVVIAKAGQNFRQLACIRSRSEHELRFATRFQYEEWAAKTNRLDNPFPFILTCLVLGFTFVPSIGYDAANNTISKRRFDNELEIKQPHLVFDITDLKQIRYCFLLMGSFAWRFLDQQNTPRMTPLSASVFFTGGHHARKGVEATLYQNYDPFLDEIEVVDAYTLNAVWPEVEWMVLVGQVYDLVSNHPQANQYQSPAPVARPLSLQSQALTKFFNTISLGRLADFPRALKRVSQLYYFSSAAISMARAHPPCLVFPISREILGKALENMSEIDLSPFYDLTPKRLLHVLEKVMRSKNRLHVTSLSLSGNRLIDYKVLTTILNAFPNLKALHLLDTPRITFAKKMELLRETKVSEYHDSELYSLPFMSTIDSSRYDGVKYPHFLVTQVIYVIRRSPETSHLEEAYKAGLYGLNLQEVNLTLPSMVNGLANFIRVTSMPGTNRKHMSHGMRILAKSMAMSEIDGEMKIAPISNALFEFNLTSEDEGDKAEERTKNHRQTPRLLNVGKWNLMVICQSYKPDLTAVEEKFHQKYAFIRAESYAETYPNTNRGKKRKASVAFEEEKEPRLAVADIDEFLQMAAIGEEKKTMMQQARASWEKCTGSLDLQMCSKAEVMEVVKEAKLYVMMQDEEGKLSLRVFE